MTGAIGVFGNEVVRVSKSGSPDGSSRRVIQNAKGWGLKLKTRSEVWVSDFVGGEGRVKTEGGMTN